MLACDQEKSSRLQQKLWRELGNSLIEWLACDTVVEVMLNPDGRLWVHDQKSGLTYRETMSAIQAMNLIGTIASLNGTTVNEFSPILECEIPYLKHRFEAIVPPVVTAPVFSIRKRALRILTLNDYIDQGVLTEHQAARLRYAVAERKTILIVGGPGTGKTTFANALLDEITQQNHQSERILILEDTPELQSNVPNTVFLRTTQHVNFQQLLRASLRLRPDRICMGECRGAEMLTLLKCWNTGTPGGIATLHANSAKAALIRVQEMVAESGSMAQPQLIAEAINIIVSLSFTPLRGRKVSDILELTGHHNQDFQLQSYVLRSPSCQYISPN